jgi:hypothetical protein
MKKCSPSHGQNGQLVCLWVLVHLEGFLSFLILGCQLCREGKGKAIMDSRGYHLQHSFGCSQKGGRMIHEWDVKDALIYI